MEEGRYATQQAEERGLSLCFAEQVVVQADIGVGAIRKAKTTRDSAERNEAALLIEMARRVSYVWRTSFKNLRSTRKEDFWAQKSPTPGQKDEPTPKGGYPQPASRLSRQRTRISVPRALLGSLIMQLSVHRNSMAARVEPVPSIGHKLALKKDLTLEGRPNIEQLSALYLRKQNLYTEQRIFPHITKDDLDMALLGKVRNMISANRPDHPWLTLSDDEVIKAARLHTKDIQTGEEGFNLTCIMLLGKDETILSACPAY